MTDTLSSSFLEVLLSREVPRLRVAATAASATLGKTCPKVVAPSETCHLPTGRGNRAATFKLVRG
jgi:hypothetical protein